MKFFYKIRDCIYNPRFYKKAEKHKLESAIRYFVLLCLLLSALFVTTLIVPLTKAANDFLLSAPNYYPAKLAFSIHNGILTTNAKQPYIIPAQDSSSDFKNIIVIDTKTNFSQKKFDKYDTFIWVTRDSLFTKSSSGQMRTMNLSNFNNITINKSMVNDFVHKIQTFLPLIVVGIYLFMLIVWYIIMLLNFLVIFLLAFIIWLLSKKMSTQLTYKQAYIIGLYAATAGLVFNTVLEVVAPNIQIPFTMTIIGVMVFFINFRADFKMKKR